MNQGTYKGLKSIVLENDLLRIEFLPQYGGKMASLSHKETDREFLFQSEQEKLEIPEYAADFLAYDSSGFDEIFPSVDASFYPDGDWKATPIPDHGEVWTLPWDLKVKDEVIKLSVVSPRFPYKLKKEINLENKKIRIDYTVTNFSRQEFKFIWCAHALLNCNPKHTKIIFPPGEDKIINLETSSEHLGDWGKIYDYPIVTTENNTEIDMSRVESKSANNCEKFYIPHKLEEGKCGVEYEDTQERLMYKFPVDKVPYLGVWKTQGGYRGDYNIALEPCTGIYDDLYVADKINKVATIPAQDTYKWYLEMKVENY
nr:DUF5107 domain-containing protein [Halobacteroides halobius]